MSRKTCPYRDLPDHAYWKRAVSAPASEAIDPVVNQKFSIVATDKISTAGSCFAQHISRHLQKHGYNYFIAEAGHPILPGEIKRDFNYGTFSARYGNIYTARQLLQTFERAYGLRTAVDDVWISDGGFIDPFRPNIQPLGFQSQDEFREDRKSHYAAVRDIVEKSDVFIFTLGLTEMWENTVDGSVYPLCPGCGAGEFDPEQHKFRNLSVAEVTADLRDSVSFIRERNPDIRILLTVSPVPLIATYEKRHVLTSTMYSKSVLRVAAQQVSDCDNNVDYFPSYEIITSQASRGRYYGEDLREVVAHGVSHVMRSFASNYLGVHDDCWPGAESAPQHSHSNDWRESGNAAEAARLAAVVCDEESMLDDS